MADGALDDLFGPPLAPEGIRPIEHGLEPTNLVEFDDAVAHALKSLLDVANQTPLVNHVLESMTFLWGIDVEGRLMMCVEEMCWASDPDTRFPRLRGMPLDATPFAALGHPLLFDGGYARIAGELFLDEGRGGLDWTITNKSGRYGFGPSRVFVHLENAAKLFQANGLAVHTHYLERRGGRA